LYQAHLAGVWRPVYVLGSLFTLWLNLVVLVVQSFQKISFLNPLAPTQSSEPAFVGTQLVVLAWVIWAGIRAVKRFHPAVASSGAAVSGVSLQ
jgi:hypothetical protein